MIKHLNDNEYIQEVLSHTKWPSPSEGFAIKVFAQINRVDQNEYSEGITPRILAYVQRPAPLVSMLSACLLIGLTFGLQLGLNEKSAIDYAYFSYGPAYAYSTVVGIR